MTEQLTYRVEHMQDKHLPALQKLFYELFRKKHSSEYLKAKYDVRYLGMEHASFIAMNGDTAISFYGMIPMPARYQGQSTLTAEACDYMTLPEFQSRGLHRELSGRSMELAKQEGVSFSFAMMSNDSLAAGKKLGWSFVPRMQVVYLPAAKLPLKRALHKSGLAGAFKDKTKTAFSDLLIDRSEYKNSLSNSEFLHIDYSADFFRYKEFGGGFQIEVHDVKMWLKGDRHLHVGDLSFTDEDQLTLALKEVQKRAAKLGFSEVIIQCHPDSALCSYLGKHYDLKPGFDVAHYDLNGQTGLDDLRVNYGDFDTF